MVFNTSLKNGLVLAGVALACSAVQADAVQLVWTGTADIFINVPGSSAGEVVTTTLTVDNGGNTLASQTWSGSDFLSFRQQGASGWWIESFQIDNAIGAFGTDALGQVINAGYWTSHSALSTPMVTSWAGPGFGSWWINGNNETACTADFACVRMNNVADNQVGGSWTAGLVPGTTVPEPSAWALSVLALAALGATSRKRSRTAAL